MTDMRIFDSKPALRWLAPVAVLALVGGTGLVAATANAGDKLPDRSAEQLLVDLQDAKPEGMSGTVVQRADLGIPDIPGAGQTGGATSMLSGTHTLMVWYSDPGKARIALKSGSAKESDLVTNGSDVWTWSSADQSATHRKVTADRAGAEAHKTPEGAPKTPEEAAQWALKALTPSTEVTTDSDVTVAQRGAYELVLRPKTNDSLLTEAKIAIDGETHVPLRVQAYAGDTLVFEVEYQSVSFNRPDDGVFNFNPPPGTTVKELTAADKPAAPSKADQAATKKKADAQREQTKTVGTGWSTVVVTTVGKDAATSQNEQLKGFLDQLEKVPAGSRVSGRLFSGKAFSAVLTDDGRVAVGAVKPELLYKALEK